MKTCNTCKETKNELEFYSGNHKCIVCYKLYNQSRDEKIKNGTWKTKKTESRATGTKHCKLCLLTLPLDNFYVSETTGHFGSQCKTCISRSRKKMYQQSKSLTAKYDELNPAPLHIIMEEIWTGKHKHDPIAHEEFCKKNKVLHYREWEFNPQRLIEIENEMNNRMSDTKLKRKCALLERANIDIDKLTNEEILNYNIL